MAYDSNIQIADLVLTLNPEQYQPEPYGIKMGEFVRTIGGGIIDMDMSGYRFQATIRGITVDQVEQIKMRAALRQSIEFIDFVPIAEATTKTRLSYEDVSTNVIEGRTVFLYVPIYYVRIVDYIPRYQGALVEYTIKVEEILPSTLA